MSVHENAGSSGEKARRQQRGLGAKRDVTSIPHLAKGLQQRRQPAGRAVPEVYTPRTLKSKLDTPYTSGTNERAKRLAVLQRKYEGYLLSDDPDILPILLGTVAAHRLDGEPSWLLVVAPPSSKKTEDLSLFSDVNGVHLLSDLTDKTFASGLARDEDPSLLGRLTNGILVFKDFTTVLEMRREQRAAVVAQLREIYDGRFDKAWGSGKELHWTGRLSVLAGVTPVIDRYYSVMNVLGQRFMLLRPRQPDREKSALRALKNCSSEGTQTRLSLIQDVKAFFSDLTTQRPQESEDQLHKIAALANFTTRARSGVERSGRDRELDYVPEPEMPARFARQLLSLARGIAVVNGHAEITDTADMTYVQRVALDSIPTGRRAVLGALAVRAGTIEQIVSAVEFSKSLVRRTLEELEILGLVANREGLWVLDRESARLLRPEKRTADGGDLPSGIARAIAATLEDGSGRWLN